MKKVRRIAVMYRRSGGRPPGAKILEDVALWGGKAETFKKTRWQKGRLVEITYNPVEALLKLPDLEVWEMMRGDVREL